MSEQAWKILRREVLLRTRRDLEIAVETVELPDGRVIDDYYQIVAADSAILFAETESGEIIALRHYMHGPRRAGIGLPGGRIDPGEEPLAAARRELLEETGYVADDWRLIGCFARNANQGCGAEYVFRVSGAKRVAEPDAGDLEEQEVVLLSHERAKAMLTDGSLPVLAHAAVLAMGLTGV